MMAVKMLAKYKSDGLIQSYHVNVEDNDYDDQNEDAGKV